MENSNTSRSLDNSTSGTKSLWKGLIIAGLILGLMIPMLFIKSLLTERNDRQKTVVAEVSSKWAKPQTITGPILMVPFHEKTTNSSGKPLLKKSYAFLLPDTLSIDAQLQPEKRNRSIYDVYLFQTSNKIKGSFNQINFEKLGLNNSEVLWQEARLILGISDLRGSSSNVALQFGAEKYSLETGIPQNGVLDSGLSTPIGISPNTSYSFELNLQLKSSEYLHYAGWGNETKVRLSSPWKTPSFEGQYLPESSSVGKEGFQAQWMMNKVSRPYPQMWKSSEVKINLAQFGVKLVDPSDTYAKNDRVVKYALLFICLTFAVFYLIELLQGVQIHPLQYILVGFALCVFYTLLLSFSEYVGFKTAYIISVSATVGLIGMYVFHMIRNSKTATAFTLGLAGLYAYIYFLIQLEEMSLLFGSLALFLVLAAIMYFTRKINWYALNKANV